MNVAAAGSMLEAAKKKFEQIVKEKGLANAEVTVLARPLTPEEAIGKPFRRDFPIIKGKERVIEACVLNAKGHAFTDSAQEFKGTLRDALALSLDTSQNRAIFIASMNATLNHLGMAGGTVHCKDDDPEKCAREIVETILQRYGQIRVGLIGLNPAIAEQLAKTFKPDHLLITDLAADNISKKKFGVEVWDAAIRTEELIEASDVIILTGTTLVNSTFDRIWNQIQKQDKASLVYGVTAAGVSELMGIDRICPYGCDE